MSAERRIDACARLDEIWEGRAEDNGFEAQHLAECDACRVEKEARDLMRNYSPVAPIDELGQRRLFAQVIARSKIELCDDTVDQPKHGSSGKLRWLMVAAAMVVGAIAATLIVSGSRSGGGKSPTVVKAPVKAPSKPVPAPVSPVPVTPAPVTPAPLTPRVLAMWGTVHQQGEHLTLSRQAIAGVEVGDQSGVVVALTDDIRLFVSPSTSLSFGGTVAYPKVKVERGTVLASVTPNKGIKFTVAAGSEQVHVTGTVFQVARHDHGGGVAVLRGSVKVASSTQSAVRVTTAQALDFGSRNVKPMSDQALAETRQRTRMMHALHAKGATLRIKTNPAGASVSVDGVRVGRSPLRVRLPAGESLLEISLADYGKVRELLKLKPEQHVQRDYRLSLEQAPDREPQRLRKRGKKRVNRRKPAVSKASRQSARRLMQLASSHRRRQQWTTAARYYRQAITANPKDMSARYSLGEIQLKYLKQPRAAERNFRYIVGAKRGLVKEAAYARTMALAALGQRDQERLALKWFLSRYGSSFQARKARQRLRRLER